MIPHKSFVILFIFGILFTSCESTKRKNLSETTKYFLIRHAEKDRTDAAERDPILTEIGFQRAKLWAHYFDSIPLNKIYSTNYARTLQTVEVLSKRLEESIILYEPETLLDSTFLYSTKGQHILICGHSNTTPMLVNKLIGHETYPEMDDSDNSSLYVVTIEGTRKKVEIRKVNLPTKSP